MRSIKVSKRKTSLSFKLSFVLVLLLGFISFVLALKYSGESRMEFPRLTPDSDLSSPECFAKGGFHTEAFAVSLISLSNSKIFYTLDGSEPSLRSAIYKKPFVIQDRSEDPDLLSIIPTSTRWKPPLRSVFKGTVLRAISVSENNKKSAELIRTFFVNERGTYRYKFPVIALTVNPDDFFGYEKGIYVMGKKYEDKDYYIKKQLPLNLPWWQYPSNYLKRGDNSVRPIHIEFYESSGGLGFEMYAGVRINGNATRGFSQKSLRISLDKKYGYEQLKYKIFPDNNVEVFNSIILRNSGNDWDKTMFRDAFMQSLLENTKLDVQAYRPSIVFINGEYWGIHNIRERIDEHYLVNKYKMNIDSIAILEHSGVLFFGSKCESENFKHLLNFIKMNDMAQISNYLYVTHQIDVVNFMDFIIANVYFCNSDWPNNNVKFWRYTKDIQNIQDSLQAKDGRWRWILFDTDWGFGYTGNEAYKLNLLEKATKTGSIGIIFSGLLKNIAFRKDFIKRFHYHLNLTFNEETVLNKIDQFHNDLKPEIEEHINRWRAIGSYKQWELNVQELKNFEINRRSLQLQQLNEFFYKYKN